MNALLNYPGAKWGMAEEIVALMPPHRSYLEPFFGSGAVLFNKPPSSIETVNDIDGDIINFFTVLREQLDAISKEFMTVPPASIHPDVWDDISRMKTFNTAQSQRRKQLHVCPLQIDIVERIILRYSNEDDVVFDPFGGLATVPTIAVRMGRYGYGCELNPGYFADGVGYLRAEEAEMEQPSLFDLIEQEDT